MGVYIKGFPLPNNCGACPLRLAWCRERIYMVTRPERCPLVPVQPHGDLIDRNKLYEKTAEWEAQALHMVEVAMNDEDVTEWRKWSTVLIERSAFKFDIADAPTIIPASGGQDDE